MTMSNQNIREFQPQVESPMDNVSVTAENVLSRGRLYHCARV